MISQEQFRSELHKAADSYGLNFSKQAENLIFQTLSAIEDDPYVRWDVTMEQKKEITNSYLTELKSFVGAFSGDPRSFDDLGGPQFLYPRWRRYAYRRRRGNVNYFDVFHFLADNLNLLNPFPKD